MLVIFDGDCGICQKSAGLLRKLDWFNVFEVKPLQQEGLIQGIENLTREECLKELKLIRPQKKILGGADALIHMSFYIPLVTWLGILFYLPPMRQLARFLYRKFASNRYRFSAQCSLDQQQELRNRNQE